MTISDVIKVGAGTLLGLALCGGIKYASGHNLTKGIPRDSNITTGYVNPSGLEIKLKDLDENGSNEVLLINGPDRFLFTYDPDAKIPTVTRYRINIEPLPSK